MQNNRTLSRNSRKETQHTRALFSFTDGLSTSFSSPKTLLTGTFGPSARTKPKRKRKKAGDRDRRSVNPEKGAGVWETMLSGFAERRAEGATRRSGTPKVQRRDQEALPPPTGWKPFASALRRPSSGCRIEGTCPPLGAGAPPREAPGKRGQRLSQRGKSFLRDRPVSLRFPAALLRPGVPSQSQVRRRYRLDARAPGMPELPHGLHRGSTAPTDGTLKSNQREGRKKARQRRKWTPPPVLPLSFPHD